MILIFVPGHFRKIKFANRRLFDNINGVVSGGSRIYHLKSVPHGVLTKLLFYPFAIYKICHVWSKYKIGWAMRIRLKPFVTQLAFHV